MTTDHGAPTALASAPASTSPSCGPPTKKIMFTAVIRPRISSGVSSCRTVWRITMLTVSAAPETASSANESQKIREAPNPAIAIP